MNQDQPDIFRENIPAYALGALDADETAALEHHLKNCTDCNAELAEYRSLTSNLLQSTPPKTPSFELRRKLAAQLPSHQIPNRGLLTRFFSQFSLGQIAVAALIVILLGSNLFSNMQIRDLKQQQSALADRLLNEQAAIAMLAYPGTQTLTVSADVQNLTGSMLVDKDKNSAVLFLWYLPELEAAQTYQAWLIDANGKRISGGLFTPVAGQDYTTVTLQSPVPMGNFTGIGVTIEPQGGSEKPTGPRVLIVNL